MDRIEAIRKRRSVRTYMAKDIDEETYGGISGIVDGCSRMTAPFSTNPSFALIKHTGGEKIKRHRFGTYGFIKDPQAFITGISGTKREELVDFGYVLETAVIEVTRLGISTCWLGGTFNRRSFIRETRPRDKRIIPCVISLGYEKRQRAAERIIRGASGAGSVKHIRNVFFAGDLGHPYIPDAGDIYRLPLEMVSLAPSASNKQPWRILISDDKKECYFYLHKTPFFAGNIFGFEMQSIDIGIAMCHFSITCDIIGLKGGFMVEEPACIRSGNMEYVASWRRWADT